MGLVLGGKVIALCDQLPGDQSSDASRTSWGFGGFMLALLAGKVYDQTGNFNFVYYCSAALLAIVAVATFIVEPLHRAEEEHVRSLS